jgi:hypothetical protein
LKGKKIEFAVTVCFSGLLSKRLRKVLVVTEKGVLLEHHVKG